VPAAITIDQVTYDFSDEASNSIAAGAISGMIFRSTKGPRQMLISGGIVATAAGIWAVGAAPTFRVLLTDSQFGRRALL
jgi:hypothetical protein